MKRVFGIALFILMGASALVLGVMGMGKNISGPMKLDAGANARLDAALGGQDAAAIAALKAKDTDGDGLSDYDELYVYHTSPYIKDTDSDGIPDGVEVKNGTDPNCPQGQDCGVPAPINGSVSGSTDTNLLNSPVLNPPDTTTLPDATSITPSSSPSDVAAAAAKIRALLKDQGVTDDILSTFDDQTLIDMYNQSAAEIANTNANTP